MNGLLESRVYGYDERGNVEEVEKRSNNPSSLDERYSYDKNNRHTDTGYVYDANGNLLSTPGGETMTYDLFNRMVSYSKGGKTWNYTYNGDNLRTSKTGDGVTTLYFWDGGNMYLEQVGEVYNSYIYGAGLNYSSDSTGHIHAYNTNGYGDVVSYRDAGGKLIEYAYDAYGSVMEQTGDTKPNPYRYRGEHQDAESGLIYLRNRYYDPKTGRFTTEDTYWNTDNMIYGDKDNASSPDLAAIMQSSNLYAYCRNDPVNLIPKLHQKNLIFYTMWHLLNKR